jgi:hypothetical protein
VRILEKAQPQFLLRLEKRFYIPRTSDNVNDLNTIINWTVKDNVVADWEAT